MNQATAVVEPPVRERERDNNPGKTKPKVAKPWAVIVLDDDKHTFRYVIEVLMKVVPCKVEKAFEFADQIDKKGRAIVWSGSQEVAELKRDQIKGGGKDFYAGVSPVTWPLGCYIEQMP